MLKLTGSLVSVALLVLITGCATQKKEKHSFAVDDVVDCASILSEVQLEELQEALREVEFCQTGWWAFEVGAARFTADQDAAVKQFATEDLVKVVPEQWRATTRLVVIGRTDATGNPINNLELSQKRAEYVRSLLIEQLPADWIVARGIGEAVANPDADDIQRWEERVPVFALERKEP